MPPIIRTSQRELLGGISQEAPDVRLENQSEDEINTYPSPADGLIKRPPTEHVTNLFDALSGTATNAPVHIIDSYEGATYLVIFDNGLADKIAIIDVSDGTVMTVNLTGAAPVKAATQAYITSNAAGDNIRALSLTQETIILNTDKTPAMGAALNDEDLNVTNGAASYSKSQRRGFYFIRSSGFLRFYGVRVLTIEEDDTVVPPNAGSDRLVNHGLIRTWGGDLNAPHGHANDDPPYNPPAQQEGYQIQAIETERIAELMYSEPQRTGATSTYRGGIRAVYNDKRQGGKDALESTIWEASLGIAPQHGSVVGLELREQDATQSAFRKRIVVESARDSGGDASIIAFSDEIERFSDLPLHCVGDHIVKVLADPDESVEGSYYVKFRAKQAPSATVPITEGVWEESAGHLVTTTFDDTTMPHAIQRFADSAEPKGFRFDIGPIAWDTRQAGDDISNPEPTFIGEPIRDLFFFRGRLGFVTGNTMVFSEAGNRTNFWRTTVLQLLDTDRIDVNVWHQRDVILEGAIGLQDTLIAWTQKSWFLVQGEPLLSPSTIAIRPVAEFEIYAKLRPVLSGVGLFFAHSSEAGRFSRVRELIRRGDALRFDAPERTGHVPRLIEGEITDLASSPSLNILVALTDTNTHTLYMYRWADQGNQRILSSWRKLQVGPTGNRTAGDPFTHVRRIMFVGETLYLYIERHNDVDAQSQMVLEKIVFSEDREDTFPTSNDDPTNAGTASGTFVSNLDRRITENEATITYDAGTAEVRFELPYLVQGDPAQSDSRAVMQIISRPNSRVSGGTSPAGVMYPVASHTVKTIGSKKVSVLGVADILQTLYASLGSPTTSDQSKADRTERLFIGQAYTMTYEFTRPLPRRRGADGVIRPVRAARFTIGYCTISYQDTGGFVVTVSPAVRKDGTAVVDRDTYTYAVSNLEAGISATLVDDPNIRDGQIRFPLLALAQHVRIVLTNDAPLPSNLLSAEWEGRFSKRFARSGT